MTRSLIINYYNSFKNFILYKLKNSMQVNELKESCKKIIAHLEHSFMHLQLWRASSWLFEEIHVYVTSWGMDQKMNQVANITTLDPQTIKIEPWDKSTLADIEKAIYDSNLWFTPQNQWDYIMVIIPPLTQERRKELTKVVAKDWEDAKIALRNKRHDARKTVENQLKAEEISENEKWSTDNAIDDIVKSYNDIIDTMVKEKIEEVMKV